MGLLDEAIREHLELKRLRGADPSAVAREQREALAPVLDDGRASDVEDEERPEHEAEYPPAGDAADPAPADPVAADPVAAAGHSGEEEPHAEHVGLGEETAELDMQAAMATEEPPVAAAQPGPWAASDGGLEPATHAGDSPASGSFDWEFPDEEQGESAPPQAPGQERLSFE